MFNQLYFEEMYNLKIMFVHINFVLFVESLNIIVISNKRTYKKNTFQVLFITYFIE